MLYSRAGAESFRLFQVSKCKTFQGWFGFFVWFSLEGVGVVFGLGVFWGFFFGASVLTATSGNFTTLNKKVRWWTAICVGGCLFGWILFGFFNENLSSSEQACTDIYIFINILTTERPCVWEFTASVKLLLDVSFLHSYKVSRQMGKNYNADVQNCYVFWILRTEKLVKW